jgi:hypothetical protein
MLRDHFHSPLCDQYDWRSLHFAWATTLAFDLNRQLPEGWYAAPSVEFGIEVDVGAWQAGGHAAVVAEEVVTEHVAETRPWEVPAPTMTIEFPLLTDSIEVNVYETSAGRILVGGIELVSPANKDRQESRDAFVTKCDAKLIEGVGMVIVDVVTSRYANLHQLLLHRAGHDVASDGSRLYAASYHPTERDEHTVLDIYHQPLTIGQPLPLIPLHLKNGPCLQVDLPGTYELTRQSLRIP